MVFVAVKLMNSLCFAWLLANQYAKVPLFGLGVDFGKFLEDFVWVVDCNNLP